MADHTVQPGDCFNSIAKANGFFNYQTLYNHGDNATLKAHRSNPNMLAEGDVVKIPAKKQKKIALTIDQENPFVVKRQPTKLRLIVQDAVGKVPQVETVAFRLGPLKAGVKPDAKGLLEYTIPPEETKGSLELSFPKPLKTAKPSPAAVADPAVPPNPPAVKPAQFQDKMAAIPDEKTKVVWTLEVGALEPNSETRGSLQRLFNLGYTTPVQKTTDAETQRAVRAFQIFEKKATTGALADIKADVEAKHDNP
jgi:hypothetical protein